MPGRPNTSFAPYERPVRAAPLWAWDASTTSTCAPTSTIPTSRSWRSSIRARSAAPSARRTGRARETFASAAELAASGLEVDAVEVLLPIPLHADGVAELLGYGWHVNLQKPICNDLDDAYAHARQRPRQVAGCCGSWTTTSSTSRS